MQRGRTVVGVQDLGGHGRLGHGDDGLGGEAVRRHREVRLDVLDRLPHGQPVARHDVGGVHLAALHQVVGALQTDTSDGSRLSTV